MSLVHPTTQPSVMLKQSSERGNECHCQKCWHKTDRLATYDVDVAAQNRNGRKPTTTIHKQRHRGDCTRAISAVWPDGSINFQYLWSFAMTMKLWPIMLSRIAQNRRQKGQRPPGQVSRPLQNGQNGERGKGQFFLFLWKMTVLGLFLFVFILSKYFTEWVQQVSNLYCQSRRRAWWPLNHTSLDLLLCFSHYYFQQKTLFCLRIKPRVLVQMNN